MLSKYNNNDYVYTTGTAIILNGHLNLNQVFIDFYRYTIGFIGSACILMVIKFSYYFFTEHASKLLILMGQKSMGIYVITVPFVNRWILSKIPHVEVVGLGGGIVETIAILYIAFILTTFFEKNKLSKKILLGSR